MKKIFYIFVISLFILSPKNALACSVIPSLYPDRIGYIEPIIFASFDSQLVPAKNIYIKTFTFTPNPYGPCSFPKTVHVNIIWLALALVSIGFLVGRKQK